MSKPTVAFAHLGCEKNRVDTEHMLGLLAEAGYGVSADETDAKVVVVNTCSFIQDAREESVRTLVELAEQGKELIIAGCLAQHFQEELLESLPEAKAIVGTGDYQHIVSVLERVEAGERVNQVSANPTFVADEHLPRYRTTSGGGGLPEGGGGLRLPLRLLHHSPPARRPALPPDREHRG